MSFGQIEKELVKFPKISYKSKSVPSNAKTSANSLDQITAKSWYYCTPNTQYGKIAVI